MAQTLRRRIQLTTIIYSLILIGVVFILTWRAYSTQREIDRIVRLQTEAVGVLERFRVFHAGLQASWTRAAEESPDAFVASTSRYPDLVGQYRDALRRTPAAPPRRAAESDELDRMTAVASARWREMSHAEQRDSLDGLRAQTLEIVELTDA